MKYFFAILLLASIKSFSQHSSTPAPFSNSMGTVETFTTTDGRPFFPKTYVDVNGSPNMFDDWKTATIYLNNGRVLKNIRTNFNLVTNDLLYLDEKEQTMVANTTVIKSIEVADRTFIPTEAKNSYVEVLSSQGKATLVRHTKKVIMETKPFNSATVQKDFRTKEDILVSVDGSTTEIKSAGDLYDVLGHADQLKEYAKKEKLKQKSVDSWVKIVDYFNSI
jgi:hypothetical protein